MATKTCRICAVERDETAFYPQGKQCRRCLADRSSVRYHTRYKTRRHLERSLKDRDRKERTSTVSANERAYAAGLIDGEGCLHISKHGQAGGTSARVGQITLHVTVRNTAIGMVEFFQARWGGTISAFAENPTRNRKAQWAWVVTANVALSFLDDVHEFLTVKQRQSQLCRRFQRYVQRTGRKRTDKIARLQERFYVEMKRLNWRGLNPPEQQ